VWLRWDPTTEVAALEDENGNDGPVDVDVQRDGAFYLIGPLDIEDPT
jgi:hypothetical protein